MIRPADTIEFGIKSTVWNKANGLCNFNAILRPKVMADRDMDNINVTTPFMNRYFKRTSCFSIWVRPVAEFQTNEDDESQPWVRINQICVTGDSPARCSTTSACGPRHLDVTSSGLSLGLDLTLRPTAKRAQSFSSYLRLAKLLRKTSQRLMAYSV